MSTGKSSLVAIPAFESAEADAGYAAVLHAVPVGVLIRNGHRIRYANLNAARAVGIDDPRNLQGKAFLDFVVPDEHARVAARAKKAEDGEPLGIEEFSVRGPDGVTRTIEIYPPRRILFDGEPCVLTVCRDVTAQRQLQAELAVAEQRASMARLAGGLAHEVNNPLAALIANLALLRSGNSSPGDAQLLDDATDAARRIERVVSEVQTFVRAGGGAPERLDVSAVLDRVVQLASDELRYRARVVRRYRSAQPVMASEAELSSALLSVVLDMLDRLPPGHVDAHVIELAVGPAENDGWIRLELSDDGTIPDSVRLDALFEPFQVPPGEARLTTGVGLWGARRIIEAAGGSIRADSRPGGGLTFVVDLPAAPKLDVVAPAASDDPSALTRVRRPTRTLIVDDDDLVLRTLERLFRHHDVTTASSGRDALGVIRDAPPFDVVLCDIMMPRMSGVALYEAVSEERPDLAERFVFLTGGAFTDADRAFVEAFPRERLVTKPFDLRDLEAAVDRVTSRDR